MASAYVGHSRRGALSWTGGRGRLLAAGRRPGRRPNRRRRRLPVSARPAATAPITYELPCAAQLTHIRTAPFEDALPCQHRRRRAPVPAMPGGPAYTPRRGQRPIAARGAGPAQPPSTARLDPRAAGTRRPLPLLRL